MSDSKIVSRWLSTKAVMFENSPCENPLYERYKDDPEMLKIHGLSDADSSDRKRGFHPQLIDIDEIIAVNPSSGAFEGASTIRLINTETYIIQNTYEALTQLLLEREEYLEVTQSKILKIISDKFGL